MPSVQSAGLRVLTEEQKCSDVGSRKGSLYWGENTDSPLSTPGELRATPFSYWGAEENLHFLPEVVLELAGRAGLARWRDEREAGRARQAGRGGEQGARHLRKHRVRGDPWMQTQTQASSSSSHAPDSFPHAIHVTC